MTLQDFLLVLVGALIGFISSIGIIIVEKWLDRFGKFNIFYKLYKTEHVTESLGYIEDDDEITFVVPVMFELQNTTNTTRVIRDLSAMLYNNECLVGKMIQVAKFRAFETTNGEKIITKERDFGSAKNSYSFVIPSQNIQREYCNFAYTIDISEIANYYFNEVKLQYFDEKNKMHLFTLRKIENSWGAEKLLIDEDWQLAKLR